MPNAINFNTVGVKNYPTLDEGIQASVLTLQLGYSTQGYGAIVTALEQCADPMASAIAINASNWCRACAHGTYVIGILPAVERSYAAYGAS